MNIKLKLIAIAFLSAYSARSFAEDVGHYVASSGWMCTAKVATDRQYFITQGHWSTEPAVPSVEVGFIAMPGMNISSLMKEPGDESAGYTISSEGRLVVWQKTSKGILNVTLATVTLDSPKAIIDDSRDFSKDIGLGQVHPKAPLEANYDCKSMTSEELEKY